MDKSEELLGAIPVPPDPRPPAWLKTLFDHQIKQFQQLVTPSLQHVITEQRSTTRAAPSTLGGFAGTSLHDPAVRRREKCMPQCLAQYTCLHMMHMAPLLTAETDRTWYDNYSMQLVK